MTPQDWKQLRATIIRRAKRGEFIAVANELAGIFFEVHEGSKTTRRQLAGIAIQTATSRDGAVENSAKAQGSSQRTFWRHFADISMPELQRQLRILWWQLFTVARRSFGFGRRGFDILIDENQPPFFGKTRYNGGAKTEAGLTAGLSKDDKWSGKFKSIVYHVMVARCVASGATLPLDVVLVAPQDPRLRGNLEIPSPSREWLISHFIGLLRNLYPTPRIIEFDRGYHSNENYSTVTKYCRDKGCLYITPAVRQSGEVYDSDGKRFGGIDTLLRANFTKSKPVGIKGLRYASGRSPVRNDPATQRQIICLYRPKTAEEENDPRAMTIRNYRAMAYYLNEPDHARTIQWWATIYSVRWNIENYFRSRATSFNAGRAHKIRRRSFIFFVGIIGMAVYGLARLIRYPVQDSRAVGRYFNVKQFAATLTAVFDAG